MYSQTPYQERTAEKPTAAFALGLVSGIFILLGGILFMVLPTILGVFLSFIPGLGGIGAGVFIFGLVGIVWGALVLFGATMMNSSNPSKVKTGAALVLTFSILSWFGSFGGFFIGFLLGLIGGIMGLVWHPSPPYYTQQPVYGPQQPNWGQQVTRICPKCGRVVEENTKFCPNCGNPLS
jgi:hypothetical protein